MEGGVLSEEVEQSEAEEVFFLGKVPALSLPPGEELTSVRPRQVAFSLVTGTSPAVVDLTFFTKPPLDNHHPGWVRNWGAGRMVRRKGGAPVISCGNGFK